MTFTSSLALLFSNLKIGLVVIPKKKPSILQTECRYFCNLGSLALKLFLMCHEMTWESALITARLAKSA